MKISIIDIVKQLSQIRVLPILVADDAQQAIRCVTTLAENGLSAVDVDDCTLNAKVDDVALIPATVPLSRSVDVPRVVADNHREAKQNVPPERDPEIPRDDVATQRVLVPVACSTIPSVPVALVES